MADKRPNRPPKVCETLTLLDDRALQKVAAYFKLLSEPTRLKVLNILRNGEHNVGELCEDFGCSLVFFLKHLAQLAQAGVVERELRGNAAYYTIADPNIYALCDLVCGIVAGRLEEQAALRRMFGK